MNNAENVLYQALMFIRPNPAPQSRTVKSRTQQDSRSKFNHAIQVRTEASLFEFV